ncbi:carboxymuconolactone decarboxylase family protein [Nocardiopsis synnemataformans]|uniref:carboxymuconolactone decarboxylase family protein n=1 Tax=Nocardiopsis synnemataformans TaxID=61305 RepID=UPI003EBBAF8D
MPENDQPTAAQAMLGDFAPDLVRFTDDILFGEVWPNPALSPRDRSLVTVATLVALYRSNELPFHLKTAMDNGLSAEELKQAITHLAFYAGWPNAMTAMNALRKILEQDT